LKSTVKPLWGEGLFLRPQHFQRQDLYHESRLSEMSRALHPYAWGIRSLRLDRDALASGTLRLDEIRAIFPDGEIYSAPDADELPPAIRLEDVDFSSDTLVFSLALPLLREFASNFATGDTDAGSALRYRQHEESAPDLFTNAVDAEVTMLRKTPRLLAPFEPADRFISMPLLRIRKTSTAGYELDQNFLFPALTVDAQPWLYGMLRRLLDVLQAKCAALYGYHREPSKNIIEFRSGDIASFWLLHTASSSFAELSHLFQQPAFHPERLFQAMLRLAGALLTFSREYNLDDLPVYDHLDPGPPFTALDNMIRELIDTVISARYVLITLTETKPSFHLGRIESEKLADASFYLGVAADMPPAELVETVPLRVKIGAPDDVDKVVLSAMPGVRLQSAPQVPAAVPVRPGTYYFSIEPHGPLYERMLQSQSIMIYVPEGFRDLKLELFGVTK
jgi:type VI secretion system protein ImpJ